MDYYDVCHAMCLHCTELKKAPCVEGTTVLVVTTVDWPGILEKMLKTKSLFLLSVKAGILSLSIGRSFHYEP